MESIVPKAFNLLGAAASLPWLAVAGLPQIPDMLAGWFASPSGRILGTWDVVGILDYSAEILLLLTFQVIPIVGSVAALIFSTGQLFKKFNFRTQIVSHVIWAKSLIPLIALAFLGAFSLEMFGYFDVLLHFLIGPLFAFASLILLRVNGRSGS